MILILHSEKIITHLVCVIGLDNQSVQVCVDIVLATNILVDQKVLAFVAEDNVNLLGTWTADIGSCGRHSIIVIKIF